MPGTPQAGAPPASAPLAAYIAPAQLGPDRMPARHPFTPERSRPFDPFLYLAHFGPRELHETDWGFGPHPHRGFITVTYLLAGQIEHRDSFGGHAIIGAGDVQWMTAARGIVHAEEPPAALRESGGLVHGFQLWVNLPAALKSIAPSFSVLRGADMPVATPQPGVVVRVIAGAFDGIASPLQPLSPMAILHVTLAPGTRWTCPKPVGWSAFNYAFSEAERGQVQVFDPAAAGLDLAHGGTVPLDLLVLTGAPIGEPIASYGPFVMNTRDQIMAAARDFQSGAMGRVTD